MFEQCFAAHISHGCQQYTIALLSLNRVIDHNFCYVMKPSNFKVNGFDLLTIKVYYPVSYWLSYNMQFQIRFRILHVFYTINAFY